MVSQCTIEHAVRLNEKMMGNVCKTFSAMYTYTLGQLQAVECKSDSDYVFRPRVPKLDIFNIRVS